ncbi:hypothetical protein A4A49_54731 [Nicotiana attenuata]|uniref:Uncharacterized protein n=1 Tax=Nicotiana attenuata TaxID=49451 RepID=A0A314KML7_NICAT|nr:hypothetical protein A4A49_54731 [Nicotiana attenuata]
MKTVSGKATKTKPISLSKAASLVSNFVADEAAGAGHSYAIAKYLNRAFSSFNELDELHREINRRRLKISTSLAKETRRYNGEKIEKEFN